MTAPHAPANFGFGPRTPDHGLFPDTWHLIPDTFFRPSFVFINISGCTFIFEEQESEEWNQDSEYPSTQDGFVLGLRTSDFFLTPGT